MAFAGKLHAGDPIGSDPTENPNCETPALPSCIEQNRRSADPDFPAYGSSTGPNILAREFRGTSAEIIK